MTIICPHCAAQGSGPRFVKRHFIDEVCKEHADKKEFTKQLAQGVRSVTDQEDREKFGDNPKVLTALNALKKKE